MSNWLQLPEEVPWLDKTLKSFVYVLRNLWISGDDIEEAIARSNWLAKQVDIRGWAHRVIPENADELVRNGRASYILLLLSPPIEAPTINLDAYWNWAEETILAPIKEQYPEIYEILVRFYHDQVPRIIEAQNLEEDDS